MKLNRSKYLAWVLVVLTYLVMFSTFLLIWFSRQADLPVEYDTGSNLIWTGGFAIVPVVGGLIASREPRNPYGWIWLILGFAFTLMNFSKAYAVYTLMVSPGSLPLINIIFLIGGYSWLIGMFMLPYTMLLFPTGKPPSPRWRSLVWISAGATFFAAALGWAVPGQNGVVPMDNPYRLGSWPGKMVEGIFVAVVMILFAAIGLSALSLVVRYRRSAGLERLQLKWLAFGAVLFALFIASDFFIELPGVWESVKETLSFLILPLAVGIAMLRYRLFDIDLAIRNTLTYGVLSLILASVYFGTVILLQDIFSGMTGQESPAVIVVSTLFIAALFQPLRRRVKGTIDRRFYRRKYDATQTLASFAQTARDEVDLERLMAELVFTVKETMQPQVAWLWLRPANTTATNRKVHEPVDGA